MGREGFLVEVAWSRRVNDEKKPCENLGQRCSDGGKSLCKGTEAGQREWASGRTGGKDGRQGEARPRKARDLGKKFTSIQEARRASGKAMSSSDLSLKTLHLAAL